MRKALIGLLITATAVTPLASASAQSRDNRDSRAEQRQERAQKAQRQDRREVRQDARIDNRQDRRRDLRQDRREDRREVRQDRREDRRDFRQDRREVRQDRRQWNRLWNRGWRNDNRYDWQRYRYTNRNLYRRGNYYAPYRNHSYNRFSIGLFLGSAFLADRYWINDPWQYRLPPAYQGTRWVRYYDDVLLVDVYTGEVVDVIHDFFW